MKYMAIEIIKDKVKEYKEKIRILKKERKDTYRYEEQFNYLVESIVYIYISLYEINNAIEYFHKNYIQERKEVKEYIILDILEMFNLNNEWIIEYEKHKDINYRDSLKEKYTEMKEKCKNEN